MNIHEHQAKELLKRFGVPVPAGCVVYTLDEVRAATEKLGSFPVVVKAQIHAGGRGKAGGVKVCKSLGEAEARAKDILGATLVTHQTGPQGREVKRLLIEQGVAIDKELYLSLVLDREQRRVVLMMSSEGGMDIEEVAEHSPEKIHKVAIDPVVGLSSYQVRQLFFALHLPGPLLRSLDKLCQAVYRAFIETDAAILEINPLIITQSGELLALDAKMNFDDNALYRHPEVQALRDLAEEDAKEIEAKEYDLSYIALDGSVGCMVNGAGLAMATMDIIKHCGGEPANFLDVGGGATAEKVTAAFKIILKDPQVKAILVNIFGGIMKCDVIAEGVIAAAKETHIRVPVVVRLQGTNVELGKKMLAESGLNLTSADDMLEAAKKVVELSRASGGN
jgi:succinyl-CoA synthetase beta subunit